MQDRHSLQIARARFDAIRRYPPSWWDETAIADYNGILAALQAAEPDKDFRDFTVPPSELAQKVSGWDRRGRRLYSSKLYCDAGRMTRRIEGLAVYLAAVDPPSLGLIAPAIPAESPRPEAAPPRPVKRAALAIGRFLWSQAQAIAPTLVNAWLKRKGLE